LRERHMLRHPALKLEDVPTETKKKVWENSRGPIDKNRKEKLGCNGVPRHRSGRL